MNHSIKNFNKIPLTDQVPHIYPSDNLKLSREIKEIPLNQRAIVIWMTGLSGAGKTTLSYALEKCLFEKGFFVQTLDGDNVRNGINRNIGYPNRTVLKISAGLLKFPGYF